MHLLGGRKDGCQEEVKKVEIQGQTAHAQAQARGDPLAQRANEACWCLTCSENRS